jgi:hypothetical protein
MGFRCSLSSESRGTRAPRRHYRARTTVSQRPGWFEGRLQDLGRTGGGGEVGGCYTAITAIRNDNIRGAKRSSPLNFFKIR